MARNGRKLAKRKSCQFFKSPDFSLGYNYLYNTYTKQVLFLRNDFREMRNAFYLEKFAMSYEWVLKVMSLKLRKWLGRCSLISLLKHENSYFVLIFKKMKC